MTFWKTVGAVVVGNIIIGLIGLVLIAVGFGSALSSSNDDSSTVDIPERVEF